MPELIEELIFVFRGQDGGLQAALKAREADLNRLKKVAIDINKELSRSSQAGLALSQRLQDSAGTTPRGDESANEEREAALERILALERRLARLREQSARAGQGTAQAPQDSQQPQGRTGGRAGGFSGNAEAIQREAAALQALSTALGRTEAETRELAQGLGLTARQAAAIAAELVKTRRSGGDVEQTFQRLNREIGVSRRQFDGLQTELDQTQTKARETNRALRNITDGIGLRAGGAIFDFGLDAVRDAARGTAAVVADSVSKFGDFDQALTEFAAKSQQARADLGDLEQQTLDLARATSQTPTAVAEAATTLLTLGSSAQQVEERLGSVVALTEASNGGDALVSARAIQQGINLFEQLGESSDSLADKIAFLQSTTAIEGTAEFSTLFQNAGAAAATAEIPFNSLAAAFSAIRGGGVGARKASTGLRVVLERLAKPTAKAAQELETLGIQAFDSEGNFKGFIDIAEQLNVAFADQSVQERTQSLFKIFGGPGASAIATLSTQLDSASTSFNRLSTDATGAAQQIADELNASPQRSIALLQSSLEALQIQFGGALSGITQGGADTLRKALSTAGESNPFESLNESAERFQQTLEETKAAKALGEALGDILGTVGDELADLVNQFAGFLEANPEAIANFGADVTELASGLSEFVGEVAVFGGDVLSFLASTTPLITELVSGAAELLQSFQSLPAPLQRLIIGAAGLGTALTTANVAINAIPGAAQGISLAQRGLTNLANSSTTYANAAQAARTAGSNLAGGLAKIAPQASLAAVAILSVKAAADRFRDGGQEIRDVAAEIEADLQQLKSEAEGTGEAIANALNQDGGDSIGPAAAGPLDRVAQTINSLGEGAREGIIRSVEIPLEFTGLTELDAVEGAFVRIREISTSGGLTTFGEKLANDALVALEDLDGAIASVGSEVQVSLNSQDTQQIEAQLDNVGEQINRLNTLQRSFSEEQLGTEAYEQLTRQISVSRTELERYQEQLNSSTQNGIIRESTAAQKLLTRAVQETTQAVQSGAGETEAQEQQRVQAVEASTAAVIQIEERLAAERAALRESTGTTQERAEAGDRVERLEQELTEIRELQGQLNNAAAGNFEVTPRVAVDAEVDTEQAQEDIESAIDDALSEVQGRTREATINLELEQSGAELASLNQGGTDEEIAVRQFAIEQDFAQRRIELQRQTIAELRELETSTGDESVRTERLQAEAQLNQQQIELKRSEIQERERLEAEAVQTVRDAQQQALDEVRAAETERTVLIRERELQLRQQGESQAEIERTIAEESLEARRDSLTEQLQVQEQFIADLEALPQSEDTEDQIRAAKQETNRITLDLIQTELDAQDQLTQRVLAGIDRQQQRRETAANAAIASINRQATLADAQAGLQNAIADAGESDLRNEAAEADGQDRLQIEIQLAELQRRNLEQRQEAERQALAFAQQRAQVEAQIEASRAQADLARAQAQGATPEELEALQQVVNLTQQQAQDLQQLQALERQTLEVQQDTAASTAESRIEQAKDSLEAFIERERESLEKDSQRSSSSSQSDRERQERIRRTEAVERQSFSTVAAGETGGLTLDNIDEFGEVIREAVAQGNEEPTEAETLATQVAQTLQPVVEQLAAPLTEQVETFSNFSEAIVAAIEAQTAAQVDAIQNIPRPKQFKLGTGGEAATPVGQGFTVAEAGAELVTDPTTGKTQLFTGETFITSENPLIVHNAADTRRLLAQDSASKVTQQRAAKPDVVAVPRGQAQQSGQALEVEADKATQDATSKSQDEAQPRKVEIERQQSGAELPSLQQGGTEERQQAIQLEIDQQFAEERIELQRQTIEQLRELEESTGSETTRADRVRAEAELNRALIDQERETQDERARIRNEAIADAQGARQQAINNPASEQSQSELDSLEQGGTEAERAEREFAIQQEFAQRRSELTRSTIAELRQIEQSGGGESFTEERIKAEQDLQQQQIERRRSNIEEERRLEQQTIETATRAREAALSKLEASETERNLLITEREFPLSQQGKSEVEIQRLIAEESLQIRRDSINEQIQAQREFISELESLPQSEQRDDQLRQAHVELNQLHTGQAKDRSAGAGSASFLNRNTYLSSDNPLIVRNASDTQRILSQGQINNWVQQQRASTPSLMISHAAPQLAQMRIASSHAPPGNAQSASASELRQVVQVQHEMLNELNQIRNQNRKTAENTQGAKTELRWIRQSAQAPPQGRSGYDLFTGAIR